MSENHYTTSQSFSSLVLLSVFCSNCLELMQKYCRPRDFMASSKSFTLTERDVLNASNKVKYAEQAAVVRQILEINTQNMNKIQKYI